MADKPLPKAIREEGVKDGRGPKWVTLALRAEADPVVGAYSYGSDDVDDTAIVVTLASGDELLFRPARTIVTRRLIEVFAAHGCGVPYYSPSQIQEIGSAIGRLARSARVQIEQTRSAMEFASVGAEWLGRCQRHAPVWLHGRKGADVRAVIEQVRATAVSEDVLTPPRLVLDVGADQLLVWTAPFRRFVRERRGTTDDGLLGVQMHRVGWRRGSLAARPPMGRGGTVELPCWTVPNGWPGVTLENPVTTGDSPESPNVRSAPFGGPTRASHARARSHIPNAAERPNESEDTA